jgi:hypothetical protein
MKQDNFAMRPAPGQKKIHTRRIWIFSGVGLAGLCVLLAVCLGVGLLVYHGSGQGGGPVPAEFAQYGSLASVPSRMLSVAVDKNARVIQLGDSATLQVPAGAFSAPNQLQVTQVDVAFNKIAYDVKQSPFYIISVRDEVGALGAPLVLEVPIPTKAVTVVAYDGQNWQPVHIEPGVTTRVEITHFSYQILGILEFISELTLDLQNVINPNLDIANAKVREKIEGGDALTQAFFGVGEAATQSQKDMCEAIMTTLAGYNTPQNREFPSGTTLHTIDLGLFLFDGSAPSRTEEKWFWNATQGSMGKIKSAVLASDPNKPLSPADVLKIAIDANGGDIPLGVLAAHNYLKEIKYEGLTNYKKGQPFPQEWGEPTSHLASWRTGSNINPNGEYDKMGPLYHIFAAMTAGLWFPTGYGGDLAANGEAFLRTYRIGADRPDLEKALADQCGVDAAQWLRDHAPTTAPAQPTATVMKDFTADSCSCAPYTVSDAEPWGSAGLTCRYDWSGPNLSDNQLGFVVTLFNENHLDDLQPAFTELKNNLVTKATTDIDKTSSVDVFSNDDSGYGFVISGPGGYNETGTPIAGLCGNGNGAYVYGGQYTIETNLFTCDMESAEAKYVQALTDMKNCAETAIDNSRK